MGERGDGGLPVISRRQFIYVGRGETRREATKLSMCPSVMQHVSTGILVLLLEERGAVLFIRRYCSNLLVKAVCYKML